MDEEQKASTIVGQPFIVADAAVGDALETMTHLRGQMKWTWRALTSGSSRHTVSRQRNALFLVTLYALAMDRTEIVVDVIGSGPPNMAHSLLTMLTNLDRLTGSISSVEALQDFLLETSPRRKSRQDPINQHARDAIDRGEDRKAVFRKWARDKKYNLTTPAERKKADDAFRQMLRNKRNKDNA